MILVRCRRRAEPRCEGIRVREAYESAVPACQSLLSPGCVNCGSGRSPISVHTHAALKGAPLLSHPHAQPVDVCMTLPLFLPPSIMLSTQRGQPG